MILLNYSKIYGVGPKKALEFKNKGLLLKKLKKEKMNFLHSTKIWTSIL